MEKSRIFLYTSDIMVLTGKSYPSAYRSYRTILDCLGKKKKEKITIREYCVIEAVAEEEVKKALGLNSI